MKKNIFILAFLVWGIGVVAQENQGTMSDTAKPEWKWTGVTGLNLSGAGFWNWVAGGTNNFGGNVFANITLSYKNGKYEWVSNLDTDLGLSWLENSYFPWQKKNDKLNFSTKLGYELKPTWYATLLASFNSQFIEGFDYKDDSRFYGSNFLNPAYTNISAGLDWKPNKIFSLYASPVAGRITTVTEPFLRERYGVDSLKTNRSELGFTFNGGINYTQIKDLTIITTLVLFTPYNKAFGNFDVDWNTTISYQFLKVLNVTLSTSLKYYDSVLIANKNGILAPRTQFQGGFGVGIGYSF